MLVVRYVLFDQFEPIKVVVDVDKDSSTFFLINQCLYTNSIFFSLLLILCLLFLSVVSIHAHVCTELSNYQTAVMLVMLVLSLSSFFFRVSSSSSFFFLCLFSNDGPVDHPSLDGLKTDNNDGSG
jgi:hypothetical protein